MLNWPQLVAQGRAKDMGIAWTEEEQEALAALIATGLPRTDAARYVRNGVMTVAELESSSEAPVTRAELEKNATDLGIEFDPSAPDTVLEKAIAAATKKAATDAKKAATAKSNTK